MKTLPLSRGLYAFVDDSDFEHLNKYKWSIQTGASRKLYASRGCGKKTIIMHRFILNAPSDFHVDHIDGNGLNNQRSNLRLCSRSQNLGNRKLNHSSRTGFKGVTFRPSRRLKWEARIQVNNKPMALGHYSTALGAAEAYNDAARRFFGEFARVNTL